MAGILLIIFLVWSVIVLDYNVVVAGFVNQRRRNFNFNDRHHIKPQISITTSSTLLGKVKGDDKEHVRKHNEHTHTKRIHKCINH